MSAASCIGSVAVAHDSITWVAGYGQKHTSRWPVTHQESQG